MNINSNTMVSITEANQNFSRVARLVDQFGSAVVLKNNKPKYIVIEFSQADEIQEASDDELLAISKRAMARNKAVYEVLAK